MRNRADEILVSTCIYDSVSKVPFYGDVAVKRNSIFEIGKGDVPEKYKNGEIKITNYGNGTICAGFGDTHTFFTGFIIDHLGIDQSSSLKLHVRLSMNVVAPHWQIGRASCRERVSSCV